MQVISYGGGVQSTALVVLAARGEIPHRLALFCNVGEDSENPDTLRYVHDYVTPWAASHGIEVRELRKAETLMENIMRSERSIPIPMRMANGAPGNRRCTQRFKIDVVARELRRLGATKDTPAHVALGISIDEYQRMRDSRVPYQVNEYPLIDRRLDRGDCQRIIASAGLPPAPKSSCFFCPFQSRAQWQRLRTEKPDLFAESVALEARMNERRASLGKDEVWLTSAGKPLDEAVRDDGQMDLWPASCDIGGYCFV